MIKYIAVLILITLITISSIFISAALIEIPSDSEKEKYQDGESNRVPQYLHHKSKCFDCEDDMIARHGEEGAWMANPSKTFSAETDGIAQAGGDLSGGFLGKTLKYY